VTSTREALPPAKAPVQPLREIRRQIAESRESGKDYGWFAYSPTNRSTRLPARPADDELPG
jgi:hypothetical protein